MEFKKHLLDFAVVPKRALRQLLNADEDAIRVYLYGLIYTDASLEEMEALLNIEKNRILEGLELLQQAGLIRLAPDGGYAYQDLQGEEPELQPVYEDAGFNNMLQAIFSDRELSYEDYRVFYELLDVYGLPHQVILMLAEYSINQSKRGNRVSMAYIRKTGRSWAKEGVDTIEQAKDKMRAQQVGKSGAADILRALNIRRPPTEQEQLLYDKWMGDWGFTHSAILAATAATTGAQYPTFRYLDGILKNLHGDGINTSMAVRKQFADNEQMDEQIKEMLRTLSFPRLTVSPEYRAWHIRWAEMGYGIDEMLLACSVAVSKGMPRFEYVDGLLVEWKEKGLKQREQIEQHLAVEQVSRAQVKKMLEAAGVTKRVSKADDRLYAKFHSEYGFSDEIIEFAASCAYGLNAPLRAMDRILERWRDAGVKTLAQAKAQNEAFKHRSGQGAGGKRQNISNIGERSYTEEELQSLVGDPIQEFLNQGAGDAEGEEAHGKNVG